jgi:hypothetical protein
MKSRNPQISQITQKWIETRAEDKLPGTSNGLIPVLTNRLRNLCNLRRNSSREKLWTC